MSTHYLAIHHEPYDRSTVFGVFDTFIAARDHLEAEAAKPDATTCERSAVIQQWSGGELIAEHERNWLSGLGRVMSPDFDHDLLVDVWTHPESGVLILGEDMPHELMPWTPREESLQ